MSDPRRRRNAMNLEDICANKHRDNPESRAANAKIAPHKATLRVQIYLFLRMERPRGATCAEIAKHFGKPMHAISGRLAEMKAIGLAVETDERRNGGRVIVADCHAQKQMRLAI
jgi:hypothetical protein